MNSGGSIDRPPAAIAKAGLCASDFFAFSTNLDYKNSRFSFSRSQHA